MVIVLIVDLGDCHIDKVLPRQVITLSLLIRILAHILADRIVIRCHLGIFPEVGSKTAIRIIPRLCRHIEMDNSEVLLAARHVSDNLCVPSVLKIINMILADQIQVILILCHHEGVKVQLLNKCI